MPPHDEVLSDGLMAELQRSVAVLVFREEDGRVLGVSRKDDPTAFTLPGGHVECGESDAEAAARELKEETGLDAGSLVPVYEAVCGDSYCTTFEGEIAGEVETDEPGVVKWCRPAELAYGPFGSYNQALFKKVGIVY